MFNPSNPLQPFLLSKTTRSLTPLTSAQANRTMPTAPAQQPIPSDSALTRPKIAAQHFKSAVAPQIKFGHQLTERDYTVTPDPDSNVNGYMASKTMRALQLRDLYKKQEGDTSHLKLNLNVAGGFGTSGEQALSDSLLFLERPTDVVVDHDAGPASVPTLMMTRLYNGLLRDGSGSGSTVQGGKRYMGRHATIRLGPLGTVMGGDNRSIQIDREKFNEECQMRAALVMQATGETDRDKVIEDLSGSQEMNALQSLAYGKHGLVDAVLVGEDQVLTREGLDTFYRLEGFNPEQIAEFNEDGWNLDQIADNPKYQSLLVPLAEYSPGSVVPEKVLNSGDRPSSYLEFHEPSKKRVAEKVTEKIVTVTEPEKSEPVTVEKGTAEAGGTTDKDVPKTDKSTNTTSDSDEELLVGVRSIDDTDFKVNKKSHFLDTSINSLSDKPMHIQIQGAKPSRGILYDDAIVFNDGFDLETADQIAQAFRALKSKKLGQSNPSNLKVVINSPGGDTRAAEKLTNELDGMGKKVKVDVIVNGQAASCGAWLLASATGNKLATPQARILIHQPSISYIRGTTFKLGNQSADNINRLYKHISGVISKATGRDRALVEKDLNQDTWMNPLEAMFYGSLEHNKGLLDGILVGSNQAITRSDVLDYLKTDTTVQEYLTRKFGSTDNVAKYLESRMDQLTKPRTKWKKADEADPFNDPVRTIMQVAARSARNLDQIDGLKASATRPWTADEHHVIDQFIVGRRRTLPGDYWNRTETEPSAPELNPSMKRRIEVDPEERQSGPGRPLSFSY